MECASEFSSNFKWIYAHINFIQIIDAEYILAGFFEIPFKLGNYENQP